MTVKTYTLSFDTKGNNDIIDLTDRLRDCIGSSNVREGLVHVFAPGSTMGLTTVEYESGLLTDLNEAFEHLAPSSKTYAHNQRWGDGNGHSHVRSSLLGSSLSVPITEGQMVLGTWQQVILVDFDNRPRQRDIVVQVLGESH